MTAFDEARRIFEILPGEGQLRRAVSILALAGVEHFRIRRWARAISREFGINTYVEPNFEANIMAVGLRLARELEPAGAE
jgi:hypothetical protein